MIYHSSRLRCHLHLECIWFVPVPGTPWIYRCDRKAHSRQSGNVLFPIEQEASTCPEVTSPAMDAGRWSPHFFFGDHILRRAPSISLWFVRCIPSSFARFRCFVCLPTRLEVTLPNRTSSLRMLQFTCLVGLLRFIHRLIAIPHSIDT